MKIRVYLTIGYANANREDEIEVPDDATEDEINDEVRDWAHNFIE